MLTFIMFFVMCGSLSITDYRVTSVLEALWNSKFQSILIHPASNTENKTKAEKCVEGERIVLLLHLRKGER